MLDRKKPEADLRKTYTLYLQVGMIVTLLFMNILFNVNLQPKVPDALPQMEQETVKMEEVEQTKQVEKPPPPPRPPVPVEVPNDEIIEDEFIDLDAELDLDAPMDLPPPPPPADDDDEPEIFFIVEKEPSVKSGDIQKELYKILKYPEMARKAGIEGRVIVQFVVDEKGNVIMLKVVRSVGGGLDEAAVSAIQKLKFSPGMQRGRPVRVQMTLPVVFKLNS